MESKNNSFEKYLDENPLKSQAIGEAILQDQKETQRATENRLEVTRFKGFPSNLFGSFRLNVLITVLIFIILLYLGSIRPGQLKEKCRKQIMQQESEIRQQLFPNAMIKDRQFRLLPTEAKETLKTAYKTCLESKGLKYEENDYY